MQTEFPERYITLGLKIAYYRKKAGMTQEVLAERIGKSQPFFLLEVQFGQLAVILLGNRACLKDVVAKLTGIVRCVQHQKG